MESLDEEQISEELKGKVLDTFVYDVKGKLGLSWAGIKAVAERMKQQGQPLSVEHVGVEESPDGMRFRAIAICKNLATGEKRTGAAEQKRFYDNDPKREIEFAYVLSVSKAQRNAIRAFLPESVITSSIEEWKDKKAHPEKYAKQVEGAVVRRAKCRDCGKDIVFKRDVMRGQDVAQNPDGTPHVDPPKP